MQQMCDLKCFSNLKRAFQTAKPKRTHTYNQHSHTNTHTNQRKRALIQANICSFKLIKFLVSKKMTTKTTLKLVQHSIFGQDQVRNGKFYKIVKYLTNFIRVHAHTNTRIYIYIYVIYIASDYIHCIFVCICVCMDVST